MTKLFTPLLFITMMFFFNSCKKDAPAATCTDGIKNGSETGIDCGGTCTACNTACIKDVIEVGGAISTATTWDSCHVYHCANFPNVTAALTIEAGTIVKFDNQ